jgi:hypothetical protein
MYKSRSAALTALRGVSFPPVYRLSLWVTLRDVPIPRSTRRTLGRAHRAFLARFQSAANSTVPDVLQLSRASLAAGWESSGLRVPGVDSGFFATPQNLADHLGYVPIRWPGMPQ